MSGRRLRADARHRSRGQVLVIFALSAIVFIGLCAVVIDVAWYWANNLRMQRAADAAALAGVVYLPGDEASAITAARNEATKNGYTNGVNGATVMANKDPSNNRLLQVTINGNVSTFFMRLFGINGLGAQKGSEAEYVLPVPMGSPENYYGVFGRLRTPAGGANVPITASEATNLQLPTATLAGGSWTTASNAWTTSDAGAAAVSTGALYQAWNNFNIPAPGAGTVTITGLELQVSAKAALAAGCTLSATLSWNAATTTAGTGWTAATTAPLTSTSLTTYTLGGPGNTWGRTWAASELTNANFRARLQDSTSGTCAPISVDALWIKVYWDRTTTTFVPDANVAGPNGETLNARGFWGTMLSQGAESINGDAYLPYYATRPPTGTLNTSYKPDAYYDYAVEMPAGTANGTVSIFDPGFCATDTGGQYGTGDRYFTGSAPFSAFYSIYDTQATPYDLTDDTLVASSANLFKSQQASDTTLNGPAGLTSCAAGATSDPTDGRYWHDRWWTLATNLTGGSDGKIYRVRTSSIDPNSASDQLGTNGMNSFSLFAKADGGSPRIYGIGAMESYSPLSGGSSSEFYLAQIEAAHAGKTVVISLWDPGDTPSGMSANVQILIPTASGSAPASLTWSSAKGTTNTLASACNSLTGSGTSITTNTGTTQRFQGCWVTILVPVPTSYTAPTPPGETSGGWWKIRYTMGGTAGAAAFDVTTWQVQIRGNPVHLVLP